MSESSTVKKKIEKVAALINYYDDLKNREISSDDELKDIRSKMQFAQKEVLKLCLESKKIIKEQKDKKETFLG